MAGKQGSDKWKKYFQSKGDIKTTISKTTKASEFEHPTNKVELPEGTEIVVYEKSSYEQYEKKYLIAAVGKEEKKLLVSGEYVNKPITGDCQNIKPQHFGLKGTNPLSESYNIDEIERLVLQALAEGKREDLHPIVKSFLIFLTKATKNNSKTAKFKSFNLLKNRKQYINEISKHFGEVIASIAAITNRELFPKLNIDKNDRIFFPKSENYPLTDFLIVGKINGKKTIKYQFSVKSEVSKSKNTNTVKPEHIIDLFNTNKNLKEKWEKTIEYKIIKILAENNTIVGPMKASLELSAYNKFYSTDKNLNPETLSTAIKKYEETKKLDGKLEETFRSAHKNVTDSSKKMNYTEFFLDVINSRIYYLIVVGFTEDGIPKWKTLGDSNNINQKAIKTMYLRYKDKENRMGLQT